jgi:hypothetical protein
MQVFMFVPSLIFWTYRSTAVLSNTNSWTHSLLNHYFGKAARTAACCSRLQMDTFQ